MANNINNNQLNDLIVAGFDSKMHNYIEREIVKKAMADMRDQMEQQLAKVEADLSAKVRELVQRYSIQSVEYIQEAASLDGKLGFLFAFDDGKTKEVVEHD